MLDFLSTLYRFGISMCLAGPTGTGKTTLMSWIMSTIDDDKRLYTVENGTREFDLVKRDKKGRVINNVIHTNTRYSDDPKQANVIGTRTYFSPKLFVLGRNER